MSWLGNVHQKPYSWFHITYKHLCQISSESECISATAIARKTGIKHQKHFKSWHFSNYWIYRSMASTSKMHYMLLTIKTFYNTSTEYYFSVFHCHTMWKLIFKYFSLLTAMHYYSFISHYTQVISVHTFKWSETFLSSLI